MARDSTDDRKTFDQLPIGAYKELQAMALEISQMLEKYYSPHAEVCIRVGELTIKEDVVNTYVKKGRD